MFDHVEMKDTLTSLIAGTGDPMRDKLASAAYTQTYLNDAALLTAYNSAWMIKKAVDIPVQDATRKWRTWQGEAEDGTAMANTEKQFDVRRKVRQAKILARLYGGAAIVIGDGTDDFEKPLEVDRIQRGGLKYLTVMPRLDLHAGQINRDPASPLFGCPDRYRFSGGHNVGAVNFHPTRLAIFEGSECVDPWRKVGPNRGWGDSVIMAIFEAMKQGDATLANVASLIFEANVDVIKIPNLMEMANDPEYEKKFLKRTTLVAASKGINRTLVMDAQEEYERKSANFSGLDKIIDQMLRVCAGAADIPMTRFMAQSPAGLSATGDGDMRNYYDKVQTIQETELEPAMALLDRALVRTTFGAEPEGLSGLWSPLEQMSEKDQAEIGAKHAETASKLIMSGIYDAAEMEEALTPVFTEIGVYPNLAAIMADKEERPDNDLGGDDPLNPTIDPDGDGKIQEGDLDLRETSFNGAQIASLEKLLTAAASNNLPKETVIEVIMTAFPGVTREIVNRMLNPLSNFTPANEQEKETVTKDAARWFADYQTRDASSPPKPLYVYRQVMNAKTIKEHYEAQGVKVTLDVDDLHVTILYSKRPVDWLKMGSPWQAELKVPAGGARVMQQFNEAVVLSFANSELEWRQASMVREGASFDYTEYTPHVTISYGEKVDLDKVKPYQGEIVLGPETFQVIDPEYKPG